MRYHFNDEKTEEIARIVFHQMFRVPKQTRDKLARMGLWEDFIQELYYITLYISHTFPSVGVREISNVAQRGIYKFLRNYGFSRPRGEKGFIFYATMRYRKYLSWLLAKNVNNFFKRR